MEGKLKMKNDIRDICIMAIIFLYIAFMISAILDITDYGKVSRVIIKNGEVLEIKDNYISNNNVAIKNQDMFKSITFLENGDIVVVIYNTK